MKNIVTVIPADNCIIVDGVGVHCNVIAPEYLHALQWSEGNGCIEFTNGSSPLHFEKQEYIKYVQPFVTAWEEAHKAAAEIKNMPFEELNKQQNLAQAKEQALALIKAKRLEEEYKGPLVFVNGDYVRFSSDVKDETRLNSLAMRFAEQPHLVVADWKVADGVYVTMNSLLLRQVIAEGFAHITHIFTTERIKREEVQKLSLIDEVQQWLNNNLHEGWGRG